MTKRSSLRRPIPYQMGCIWGFISLFDFRHGRSTHKFLSDRRRGSKQSIASGYSKSQLLLTNSDQKCQTVYDGAESETEIADFGKTSVKELMEEEMVSELEPHKRNNSGDVEPRLSDSGHRGRAKKNRKRKNKTKAKSWDASVESEYSRHQVSDQKILNNCDLDVMMEELFHQIHQKSTSCAKCDLDLWSNLLSPVSEEKMTEALRVFLNQRFTDENSKESMDSLQTLISNKELFMKLLRDPNSILVKCIQDVGNSESEKDLKPESVERSDVLDEELSKLKQSELVDRKNHNFFWRKRKSEERKSWDGSEMNRSASRIVVLKPRPANEGNPETESNLKSSSGQSERISSQFSFTEIKRKLKHAMGKERYEISSDSTNRRFPDERQNSGNGDKGVGVENSGWSSPNRNHFYTERFARFSTGTKRREKIGNKKDIETNMGSEIIGPTEKRVSKIYIEAKKHLSEMLTNGDESEEFLSRKLPKTLGRILSLPEFNFSPICSPGRDGDENFVTAKMRFSLKNDCDVDHESACQIIQEKDVISAGSPRQNIESLSCLADEEVKASNSNPFGSDKPNHADAVEETSSSMRDEAASEGDVEIVKTSDTLFHEDCNVLVVSAEICSSSIPIDGENGHTAEICDEEKSSLCLNSNPLEEVQSPSSPLASPSTITMKSKDVETANEKPAQPSPVSVLEPFVTEDDISPTSIKYQTGEKTIQPIPIHLEEQTSCSIDYGICIRTSMQDEDSTFEYVEAVLLGSGLNWDEFLFRWLSSDELLEPSLFDEVELFSNRYCEEQKLLFDCTNEVLEEVCERYFGYSPWVSFVKKNVRPIPRGKNLICEVWEGVKWHLLAPPPPITLDQIVRKDMEKDGKWTDLRSDTESVSIEIGEVILEELLEDTILSFVDEDSISEFAQLPADLTCDEISTGF